MLPSAAPEGKTSRQAGPLASTVTAPINEEHALSPREERRADFLWLEAGGVELFVGDFFATTRELLGACNAYYDRAALVALPPEMRPRYVRHVRSLLPNDAPGLVVTFEYDQQAVSGPPFSVPEDEVRREFAGAKVRLLARDPAELTRARSSGVPVVDCCYEILLSAGS